MNPTLNNAIDVKNEISNKDLIISILRGLNKQPKESEYQELKTKYNLTDEDIVEIRNSFKK